MKRKTIAAMAMCGVLLAGCSSSGSEKTDGPKETLPSNTTAAPGSGATEGDDTTSTEPKETTTTAPKATTTTAPPEPDGSKASPLSMGKGAVVGDWEVTVTQIVPNATAEVQGANQFNDPPSKGQYMKVVLDATYKGSDEGQPDFALNVVLSGSDKVQYDATNCGAAFGSSDMVTLEPGGKATVMSCIDAPPAAMAGGTLFVEDQLQFDGGDSRAYWKMP